MSDDKEFNSGDFREAFLQANANRDFISHEFADVIRYLVRAVAAHDPSGPICQASEKMTFVTDLLRRAEEPISWYGLFADAIQNIHDAIPEDRDERRYIGAAQRGTKYLIESSATDNAARGRASRRLDEFLQAIRWSEEARGRRA